MTVYRMVCRDCTAYVRYADDEDTQRYPYRDYAAAKRWIDAHRCGVPNIEDPADDVEEGDHAVEALRLWQ